LCIVQAYLLNTGEGADGRHNAIPHLLYWSWNSESIDTGAGTFLPPSCHLPATYLPTYLSPICHLVLAGGLVDSSEHQLIWTKVRWLNEIGLEPWYKTASVTKKPPPPLGTPRVIPPPPYGWSHLPQFPPVYARMPPPPPFTPPNQFGDEQLGLVVFPPSTYGNRPLGGARSAEASRPLVLLMAAVAALVLSALLLL
jgi:hypothetical protein